MKITYLEHYVGVFLDHNLGFTNEETEEHIKDQLSVSVYRSGLEVELLKAFENPNFSWLSLFKSVWKEPESNGLVTEEDARVFAIENIWNDVHPNVEPPKLP